MACFARLFIPFFEFFAGLDEYVAVLLEGFMNFVVTSLAGFASDVGCCSGLSGSGVFGRRRLLLILILGCRGQEGRGQHQE